MTCLYCGYAMRKFSGEIFWCPQCGTIKNDHQGTLELPEVKKEELFMEWKHQMDVVCDALSGVLETHFGARCPDYEPNCICCQRWKAFDEVTRNPYTKD